MVTPQILQAHFATVSECPLCSSRDGRELFKLDSLLFCQCPNCSFRYMNPALTEEGMGLLYQNSHVLSEANPALENYYEAEAGKQRGKTREDYLRVLEYAEGSFSQVNKRRLFEVGFGSGAFLIEARDRGWDVAGIDTSEENSWKIERDEGISVDVGNFGSCTPSTNTYSVIALWDVIEHTTDPKAFVQKAYDMLVPGGLLMLATPIISGLLNKVAEFFYYVSSGRINFAVKKLYVLEHVGYFNQNTLSRLVQEVGFLVDKVFLTETDFERYQFGPFFKLVLRVFFGVARILRMQNRIILFAKKPHA